MRIGVTGRNGQVAQSLLERATSTDIDVVTIARPQIDLASTGNIADVLNGLQLDATVSAAAYTAVDLAEREPDLAKAINTDGAAAVAKAAAELGLPVIHLSTDYVFNGNLNRPYRESDPTDPLGVYGKTKLDGEHAVALANSNHAILRTAWVYSPFGKNFARTMLNLASNRDEISVVSDQLGSPTSALDIADGVIAVARNLVSLPEVGKLRGVFHMTGGGETTWAGFAEGIFSVSSRHGGPSAKVIPISTSAYPTPARRPANSRLDSRLIHTIHGIQLPHWQISLSKCIERIVATDFSGKDVQ